MKLIQFTILALLVISCSSSINNNPTDFPDSNLSFNNHILPLLRNTCGLSYCHGEVSPRGNVQIYDYFSLMNSYNGALVIPGNPDGSVLVQIIEYKLPHRPNLQWQLNSKQIQAIRKWIAEGAKNN
ncbi:hypothetical protein D9V84_06160 [Bacteroidetes/Chlorobi group bacterium Naka2016]|jgi:hypothetical protein|nr:MAG: hypothetical protein D9V84_06160 [Bacteroidetes/Chlorobi group bacterium Naka2016]